MLKTTLLLLFALITLQLKAQTTVQQVLCDYRSNPLAVDNTAPALSWQLASPQRNVKQTAYQVLVADDSLLLKKDLGNIWNSKRVISLCIPRIE